MIKIQDSIVAQAVRLERIENLVRKQRREGVGMLVMTRATVSDFDQRVGDVEDASRLWKSGRVSFMPDEPISITRDILIAIREDISSFRTSVERRLDLLEQTSRKHRHDAAAIMVLMRAMVSQFNQRVGAVEDRVTALETPQKLISRYAATPRFPAGI